MMADAVERYIIASVQPETSDRVLSEVKAHLEQDPGASIVRSGAERLVVEMQPLAAERLRSTFADKVVVEPDSKLIY